MVSGVLEESALIEAIMMTRTQIDFLWQVFITVHIAVFAMLFIYGKSVDDLKLSVRTFAALGMAAFEWINGKALTAAYLLLDAMQDQYRAAFGQPERFQPKFYEQFVLAQYSDRPNMVLMTHGTILFVVATALVARKLIQNVGSDG
ncbi:MAG: hypothetical protein JNM89_11720 [Hyphomicrobiaceae bacterium]|nr:hypothetical protein [Hyphomicrobiaceae bacterium]